MSGEILIVGGGVAGLEALIALRALAGDRVPVTLVSQGEWFVDRPVMVVEPFGLGAAARYPLPEIAAELDAGFVQGDRRGGGRRRAPGRLRRRHQPRR